jgi:hypothetical protein
MAARTVRSWQARSLFNGAASAALKGSMSPRPSSSRAAKQGPGRLRKRCLPHSCRRTAPYRPPARAPRANAILGERRGGVSGPVKWLAASSEVNGDSVSQGESAEGHGPFEDIVIC